MDGEYWKKKRKAIGNEKGRNIQLEAKVLDSNNEHEKINADKQEPGNMSYCQEHGKILGARVKSIK